MAPNDSGFSHRDVLGLRASGTGCTATSPITWMLVYLSHHTEPHSMEVLAIATTVCTLCKAIHLWIDEHAQKEALLSQIASSVLQIHNILMPFASAEFKGNGEAQLSDSIRSIGDVLQRTKEHLVVWKSKRWQKLVAVLNPTVLIAQLRDDEMQLNRQLIILLTSMAVVGYFRDHPVDPVVDKQLLEKPPPFRNGTDKDGFGPLEQFSDVGAREFWGDYIGAKVRYVTKLFSQNS